MEQGPFIDEKVKEPRKLYKFEKITIIFAILIGGIFAFYGVYETLQYDEEPISFEATVVNIEIDKGFYGSHTRAEVTFSNGRTYRFRLEVLAKINQGKIYYLELSKTKYSYWNINKIEEK